MILRLWRGVTPLEKAQGFLEYMKQTGVPDYLQSQGNRGAMIISRSDKTHTEFQLLSLWDSIDDLKRFGGEDYEVAKYPFPRDREFLIKLEEKVEHFDVLMWDMRCKESG